MDIPKTDDITMSSLLEYNAVDTKARALAAEMIKGKDVLSGADMHDEDREWLREHLKLTARGAKTVFLVEKPDGQTSYFFANASRGEAYVMMDDITKHLALRALREAEGA